MDGAGCALRSTLCAAFIAFAAAMIRCYIMSKGFHYVWRIFAAGDLRYSFVAAKKLVTHVGLSFRVITCYAVSYIPIYMYHIIPCPAWGRPRTINSLSINYSTLISRQKIHTGFKIIKKDTYRKKMKRFSETRQRVEKQARRSEIAGTTP